MSLIAAVTMPKWGMTMTEGTVVQWLAKEGDRITRGQELLEIESTKVSNVVEATADGILKHILLREGDLAPVGALIGVIAHEAATPAEIDALIERYADRMTGTAQNDAMAAPRSIVVAGGHVNVLEAGSPSDQSIVLIHGFGGDLSTWIFNQDAFAEHLHTVALDLPAHGASSLVTGDDIFQAIVDAVAAAVQAVAPGPRHLVGHSFGGAVAAAIAASDPAHTTTLTLIAPIGLGRDINRAFLTDFIAADRRRALQGVLERLFADPTKISSDMVESTLRFKRLEGVSQALARVADVIADENGQVCEIAAHIEKLDCPVTVIWGENDAIIPIPDASLLPPNVTLHILPDVGHMPQMEAASRVNNIILDTLQRV